MSNKKNQKKIFKEDAVDENEDDDDFEYELTDDSDAEINENFYEGSSDEEEVGQEINDKKPKKKVGKDDSQFYDPEADVEDQLWVNGQLDPIAANEYKTIIKKHDAAEQEETEPIKSTPDNNQNKQQKKKKKKSNYSKQMLF